MTASETKIEIMRLQLENGLLKLRAIEAHRQGLATEVEFPGDPHRAIQAIFNAWGDAIAAEEANGAIPRHEAVRAAAKRNPPLRELFERAYRLRISEVPR